MKKIKRLIELVRRFFGFIRASSIKGVALAYNETLIARDGSRWVTHKAKPVRKTDTKPLWEIHLVVRDCGCPEILHSVISRITAKEHYHNLR